MRTVRPGIALVLVLFGLVLVPAAAYAVLGDFAEPPSSPEPIGKNASSIAAGDFDNDGDNDLAVGVAGGVAIRLNDGKGDFSAPGTSPETVVGGAWSIVAGKFNADANLDLVVGSETDLVDDGRVTILLGDGKGDFIAGLPTSLKGAARDVAAADVDADDDLDVIVGEFFPAQVAILRNDGSGSLAAPLFENAGGSSSNIFSIATGDFSGDGEEDFVVANEFTSEVTVYVNDGDEDGDFTEGVPVTGVHAYSLATGFFDAAGALDVAVATETAVPVVLLGNGSGGLSKAASPPTLPGPAHAIASADFNVDGKADLAVTGNNTPGYAAVLFGNGDGSFAAAPSSPESVGAYPWAFAAVPLDANSSPDLAIANLFSESLNILLNDFTAGSPSGNPPQQNPPTTVPVTNLPQPTKKPACTKTQTMKAGKCVRKKCPKGKKLAKNGRCVKKKKPAARSRRG